uniref:Uncharacterized protein n=1 Tax=Anguilla anguilla TaxID=7936 RepID=A0A0E9VW59_ANGAN
MLLECSFNVTTVLLHFPTAFCENVCLLAGNPPCSLGLFNRLLAEGKPQKK